MIIFSANNRHVIKVDLLFIKGEIIVIYPYKIILFRIRDKIVSHKINEYFRFISLLNYSSFLLQLMIQYYYLWIEKNYILCYYNLFIS